MATPRPQTVTAKAATIPKKPPVNGGSTTKVLLALTIAQAEPADRQRIAKDDPQVARVVLTEYPFANLRHKTREMPNEPLQQMQQIDDAMNIMARSKEAQKLEMSIAPLRTEVNERAGTQKAFADSIEEQFPKYKQTLVTLLTDIANNNTKPSHIDPMFSQLERSVRDKEKELASLMRNNDYLLVKMQTVNKQVQFQVVAFKSEAMLQGGQAPQLR